MSARRRVLIVKMSSLGDIVHALPAISDLADADPSFAIDWVCEESFADIPRLHPAIERVIPSALRRWRRSWTTAAGRREIAEFTSALRERAYDVVLDLQGLVKSALIVRMARGETHGYSWSSAREPLASLVYAHRHRVSWDPHAIARNRQLAASALGLKPTGVARYGLDVRPSAAAGASYVVALHATSRNDKLWSEQSWRVLLAELSAQGVQSVLPWGSEQERARSDRLAANIGGTRVPPRMSPGELAALFAGASAVVGVDTGLLHLAAAVGVPSLGIFVATDPALTGVIGERAPARNLGGNGSAPEASEVVALLKAWLAEPVAVQAR